MGRKGDVLGLAEKGQIYKDYKLVLWPRRKGALFLVLSVEGSKRNQIKRHWHQERAGRASLILKTHSCPFAKLKVKAPEASWSVTRPSYFCLIKPPF